MAAAARQNEHSAACSQPVCVLAGRLTAHAEQKHVTRAHIYAPAGILTHGLAKAPGSAVAVVVFRNDYRTALLKSPEGSLPLMRCIVVISATLVTDHPVHERTQL
jgi:hypothetical protein